MKVEKSTIYSKKTKKLPKFEQKTDLLERSMNEIAESVNTISHAIEDGVSGVVSAADSTQHTGARFRYG